MILSVPQEDPLVPSAFDHLNKIIIQIIFNSFPIRATILVKPMTIFLVLPIMYLYQIINQCT